MGIVKQLQVYGDTHHPKWLDILRITLGILLFVKGIKFVSDIEALNLMIESSKFTFVSFSIAHYVAFAHLVGGLMIAVGLLTRLAIIFQLPILIGAVILINAQKGFFSVNSELEFSILVLVLLVYFLIYGSGPLSVDNWLKKPSE